MAKKPETIFGEKVDKLLKKEFGKDIWIENIQQTTKIGTPDRLICIKGRFIALELKTAIGKPSRIQILKLLEINRAGGSGFLVTPYTLNTVMLELRKIYASL